MMYAGKKLKQLRRELDLSQAEFAELLELSQSYYSAVEVGKRRITAKMIEKIKNKWGVTERYFTEDLEPDKVVKMRGKNEGINEGYPGVLKTELLNRVRDAKLPEKGPKWLKIYAEVNDKLNRVRFLYQRINDIKILIYTSLEIKQSDNDYDADTMHSIFKDDGHGVLRMNYSTTDELVSYNEELNTLIKLFDARFFELFQILYQGLRKDISWTKPLPYSI